MLARRDGTPPPMARPGPGPSPMLGCLMRTRTAASSSRSFSTFSGRMKLLSQHSSACMEHRRVWGGVGWGECVCVCMCMLEVERG